MRQLYSVPLFTLCAVISGAACGSGTQSQATPVTPGSAEATADTETEADGEPATMYPQAARQDVVDSLHGVQVADPYRWLEDADDPAVAAWVDAQDELARAALAREPRRDALRKRFQELFYIDFVSPPYHRAGRYFYTRRHKDKEKAILYWKQGKSGEERVLIDPNTLSEDGTVSLKGWDLSWDGKKVAYKLSENNADEATLYVRDIASGQDSTVDVIRGAKYAGASWTPDNRGFYYEWLPVDESIPVSERPGYTELRYHVLGTDPAEDEQVFPATGNPQTFLGGWVTRDGRWLLLQVQHGWNRHDIYVKDLKSKRRPRTSPPARPLEDMSSDERVAYHASQRGFVPLAVGVDARFGVDWWKGSFYVHTDHGAPNYRVYKVDPRRLDMGRWQEIVPESEATIRNVQIIGDHLVLSYMRNAASEIEVRDLGGRLVRKIELPDIGSAGGMVGNPDEDEAYFGFSSFTMPTQVYETSIQSGKTSLWAKIDIPVDTSKMRAKQVWYPSKDGTRVSMFIVHNQDIALDGNNPVLLYGYGGFNVNMTPSFSSQVAVWLEHGGIYALPNLRGGGEYGEDWHRAGMLLDKQNVFDDYIAAAEHLIAGGYTSPDKLAISGGSNGGLLVGAAMTQRPELYRAVVCAVPLLDMVRYHLFGSGKTWIPEYGSAEDPDQFRALYAYSPYHRVKQGTRYPTLLMMAADSDDRVDPLHARKFTAAMQWANGSPDRPVLMRVERNAGHGGADLVKQQVERSADLIAFLLWQLGV